MSRWTEWARNRAIVAAVLMAALTSLAACGSDDDGTTSTAADSAIDASTSDGTGSSDDTSTSDDASSSDDASNDATDDGQANADTSTCVAKARKAAPKTFNSKRPAQIYLPKDWDGCKAYPLVVLLHGYSATGAIQNAYLGLSARVDSHGFVLIVPEGTKAPNGNQFWNATDACCDFYKQGIDDVAYIRGLIASATADLAIDPERVYLFGHSNGGFMSYRMACEASDVVTGIVSLAGAVTASESLCSPKRPVNVLQIHGTNDQTIGYNGGPLFPSAPKAVERWRGLNGCKGAPTAMAAVDFDSAAAGAETTGQTWSDCAEGTQAGLWTMKASGHIPGFNNAFRDAVVTHLLGFSRKP